jgi:hypothetical protein
LYFFFVEVTANDAPGTGVDYEGGRRESNGYKEGLG